MKNIKDRPENYIRVGTTYYKLVIEPKSNGKIIRLPWSVDTIKQDLAKEDFLSIKKYHGFWVEPNHIDYEVEVDGFLNEYHPLPFSPKSGEFETISYFLKHTFQEHFDLILDYFSILYRYPRQKLPIILLVSSERGTGKTSFLKLCKKIFGENCTYNDNNTFKSTFNSDWVNSLLVVNDEAALALEEISEKLKNMSTGAEIKMEAKGRDKTPREFFAKFILCSNNELKPIIIGEGETRYWVRKVQPFKNWINEISDKMTQEIPAFLYHLMNRKISTKNESRMWFDPKLLYTDALAKIIRYSKPRLELEIAIIVNEIIEDKELNELNVTVDNLLGLVSRSNQKADRTTIKKILSDDWKLQPVKNSLTYTAYYYTSDGYLSESKQVGRYYTLKKDFIRIKI